ncbi:TonB-dependent receptor [Danxiaibacter flavus]|uniref:TonB-dependent receptor n=1 Tax=Danxiaibacter flavus TaxID=3049108 RepID=A0ABV3ZGA0_9BACT|nr:TonB-dependent receptor [Chitinophagaceae bacterium DXS]
MKHLLHRTSFNCKSHFGKVAGILIIGSILHSSAFGQQVDTVAFLKDTNELKEVSVSAFATNAKWKEVPAAISVINQQQLHVLDNASLVPVLNTVAGVRMEERSPGSYRLSIRGSLLRSPFGVRNVRLYWNDIPFTDAGGNTYLQLVDLNQLSYMEVIKGPASSLYGANTGGAVIMHPYIKEGKKNILQAGITGGSYGLFAEHAGWDHNSGNFHSSLQQSHTQSDGYRQNASLRRDAVQWNSSWEISPKEKLSAILFYTDMFYKTPGGLTKQQMDSMPSMARPASLQQKAAVYNKTAFAGISLESQLAKHFKNTTSLTVNHTDFKNPFITNYEKRNEWNYGARTSFDYAVQATGVDLHLLAGGEWQQNYSRIDDYDNDKGIPGNVQSKDVLYATQYFLFTQVNATFFNKLNVQVGISSNKQLLRYKRISDPQSKGYQENNTDALPAPRFSVSYPVAKNIFLYAVAAKGFSPPTLAEIRPGDGNFYNLQPENGWNYEAGIKGSTLQSRLQFDVSFYDFRLKNAIVRRVSDAGTDYFVNAGSTKQQGVEAWFKAFIIHNENAFLSALILSNSFSYQPYKFDQYVSGANNYSGNKLTGVPRNINASTLEAHTRKGYYATVSLNATGKIPLNDANSVYADSYQLMQMKIGYQKQLSSVHLNFFGGIDNLLNQSYSLGNDLNAAGNRYFNPAAKRNFWVGCTVEIR